MKKKGFTLVELLAVIVILAIIAIIAVPQILNTVEDSRKGAWKSSTAGILTAAEFYYAEHAGEQVKINLSSQDQVLEYKGTQPQSGFLYINSDGEMAIEAYNGTYCAVKDYKEAGVSVYKVKEEECSYYLTYGGIENKSGSQLVLENTVDAYLANYTIHGLSKQETATGKNIYLLDYFATDHLTSFTTYYGVEVTFDPKTQIITLNGTSTENNALVTLRTNPLLLNGEYTLFYEYLGGKAVPNGNFKLQMGIKDWSIGFHLNLKQKDGGTSQNINNKEFVNFQIRMDAGTTLENYQIRVQLEKNDHQTAYEKPMIMPSLDNPSPIHSLGRYNAKTKKYEIDIISQTKNLIDPSSLIASGLHDVFITGGVYQNDQLKIQVRYLDDGGFEVTETALQDLTNYSYTYFYPEMTDQLQDGHTYTTLYSNQGSNSALHFQIINLDGTTTYTATFTYDSKQHQKVQAYIQGMKNLKAGTTAKKTYYPIVQDITEGKGPFVMYEKHQETLFLDQPLRSVGDVADTIDFKTETLTRKIDETKFTEQNKAQYTFYEPVTEPEYKQVNVIYNNLEKPYYDLGSEKLLSNFFLPYSGACLDGKEKEGMLTYNALNPSLVFSIKTNRFNTVTDFQNFLIQNQFVVQGVLKTSIREKIHLPMIPTYEGGTIVTVTDGTTKTQIDLQYATKK